jgi:hypothetical protein
MRRQRDKNAEPKRIDALTNGVDLATVKVLNKMELILKV